MRQNFLAGLTVAEPKARNRSIAQDSQAIYSVISSAQYTQGIGVPIGEIRPGDLLFFGGRRSGKARVGHVGMAVDVDESGTVTFIHAATSGGIRYDRYPDGGYYSNRFIGARRVLE